jgi:hypothetical protein
LQKVGYDPNLVNEVIGKTPGEASIKKAEKMGILKKVRSVLFSPTKFFEKVREEVDIKEAFKYILVLALIPSIIISIIYPMIIPPEFIPLWYIIGPIIYYFFIILGFFVQAAILHLFVKLLGGKKSYSETYKASVYSYTPMMLFGYIGPFLSIMWFYRFFIGMKPGLFGYILLATVWVVFMLWSLYILVIGLSKLHEMTKKRAFVVVALFIILVILIRFGFGAFMDMLWSARLSELEERAEERIRATIVAMEEKTISIEDVYSTTAATDIMIKNTGSVNIASTELGIYIDGTAYSCTNSFSISPGDVKTCKIDVGCTDGEEVKVTSPGTPAGDLWKC